MASLAELDGLLAKAMSAHQAGRLHEAQATYRAVLKEVPQHSPTLHFLGLSYFQQGKADRGIEFVKKALALKPDYVEAHYNLATALQGLGRLEEATEHYGRALALDPNNPDAHNNLGAALHELKRYEEAIEHFQQALAFRPRSAEHHNNIGTALKELHRYEEAITHFETSLAINPRNAETRCNLGAALAAVGLFPESLAAYEQAAAIDPAFADAELGRGNALSRLDRHDDALAAFDRALAKRSDLAEAWLGRGNVHSERKRHDEAFAAYNKALKLKPGLGQAWLGLGKLYMELRRIDEAFAAYDKAFALDPDLPDAEGHRLHSKMHLCDWRGFDSESAHLIASIRAGKSNATPFSLLPVAASPSDQFQGTKLWMASQYPVAKATAWQGQPYEHGRIRLGYVSADFRDHPVSYLMAGLIEQHDRTRFEVTGLSLSGGDSSEIGQRIRGAFDSFHDVSARGEAEIADLIRKMEIDILVDLTGLTQSARTGIFARRPAPVQVNYLGYAGTAGVPFIDYIVADRIVIPDAHREFYSEKVVHLPNAFMASDSKRAISAQAPQRKEQGLPETGFVFCSFNNSYKITPKIFDVWMRLLGQIDGSVLWLSSVNETATRNLRAEAKSRGVDPDRLVFAPRLARNDEHLARCGLADLFLDTLPYNAHATTNDALWAGLPVLTCRGETFAGRVAASLLTAIDLPELIAESLSDYEARAVDLARSADKLAAIKGKLADRRLTAPLFDTVLFARHIEAAYAAMHERHRSGLAPDHLTVPA